MTAPAPASARRAPPARDERDERGAAMIVVIAVMIMVLAICATTLEAVSRETRAATEGRDRLRAFYVAEAGFHRALSRVRSSPSLRSAADIASAATSTATFGGGAYTTSASVGSDDTVVITCTATVGKARRTIEAVVDAAYNRPVTFRYAAHAGGWLYSDSLTIWDSYLSSSGPPSGPLLGGFATGLQHADLSADGTFQIYTTTRARGTLYLGPDASGSGGAKDGSVQLQEPQRMPRILRPDGLPASSGPLGVSTGAVVTIGPGTFVYDSISLSNGSQLRITGPATVVSDGLVTTADTSSVYFDHGAGRRISAYFADGRSAYLRVQSPVTPPATCNIWYTGDTYCGVRPVTAAFYGTVYMYGDTTDNFVSVTTSQAFVGAVYSAGVGTVQAVGAPRMIYDEDLVNVPIPVSSAPTFDIKRWRELP